MTERTYAYVRSEMLKAQPAPANTRGLMGWARENLFSSPLSIVLSALGALLAAWVIWTILNFGVFNAIWTGSSGADCRTGVQNGNLPDGIHVGACWPYVGAYFDSFIYGRYPVLERWRVDIFFLLTAISTAWVLIPKAPAKALGGVFFLVIYPVASVILLTGGNLDLGLASWIFWALVTGLMTLIALLPVFAGEESIADRAVPLRNAAIIGAGLAAILFLFSFDFGLSRVETPQWGGLLVTLVIAITGIVASLPIGILFALGRRSQMPAIRLISVIFIEFWRGVPLITVLFMSSVMLPLFL
ncbi:MAG: ABC transporter permease subunit, partial [Hyphomicrobiaceae bacterium]|nr:ABC transporter permease subunit [Hyphomicrobiaceae bacterium]